MAENDEPCPHCDDSGYVELVSGGIWTGANITSRLEICDCICGDDVRRERQGIPFAPTPKETDHAD